MNEPNSVIAGLLALSIAAGTKTDPATGKCENVLDLPEAKSTLVAASALWPGAAGADVILFDFVVPDNSCLIVDYVSLFSCDAAETSPALDYGINFAAKAYWRKDTNGAITNLTTETDAQNVFNRPVFLVFPGGCKPQIVVKASGSTQADESRLLLATMSAYQCNSNLFSVFNQYSSNFAE